MKVRGFEKVVTHKDYGDEIEIKLPCKATRNSVGYDFFSPIDVDIPPQAKVTFKTDIKAYMQPGEMLILLPRSSTGIKNDLMLANTAGVGENDFYGNVDNEGNYSISLRNLRPAMRLDGHKTFHSLAELFHEEANLVIPIIVDLSDENTIHIKAGDKIIQGIFIPTLLADNGNSDAERVGGIGSTGK